MDFFPRGQNGNIHNVACLGKSFDRKMTRWKQWAFILNTKTDFRTNQTEKYVMFDERNTWEEVFPLCANRGGLSSGPDELQLLRGGSAADAPSCSKTLTVEVNHKSSLWREFLPSSMFIPRKQQTFAFLHFSTKTWDGGEGFPGLESWNEIAARWLHVPFSISSPPSPVGVSFFFFFREPATVMSFSHLPLDPGRIVVPLSGVTAPSSSSSPSALCWIPLRWSNYQTSLNWDANRRPQSCFKHPKIKNN